MEMTLFKSLYTMKIRGSLATWALLWHNSPFRELLHHNCLNFASSVYLLYTFPKCPYSGTSVSFSENLYEAEVLKFTVKHKAVDLNDAIVGECTVFLPALLGKNSFFFLIHLFRIASNISDPEY